MGHKHGVDGPHEIMRTSADPLHCGSRSSPVIGMSAVRSRRAALFEAQGLVQKWHIQPSELWALARQIRHDSKLKAERVREVHREMAKAGLTLDDLAVPAQIKYQHPLSGSTWDGQGPQPQWLRHALLAEGYRPVELLCQPGRHDLVSDEPEPIGRERCSPLP